MVNANTKIAKNSILLYLRMAFVMLVNLYTVRVILNALGAEDYGIYNVVAGVATMFASITGVLSASTQRYLSYALGEGNNERLRNVFSASINIFLIISLCFLLLGEVVGVWFVNSKLIIPETRISASNLIFQFSLLSVIITLLQVPFSAAAVVHEDLHIFAIVSIIECLLKLFIAESIDYSPMDRLVYYGLCLSIVSLFSFILYFVVCKRKYKECSYHRVTETELHKSMLTFSGWTFFTSGASIAMNQVITILLNIFFGPIVNAARAVSVQVNSAMCTFTSSFITAVQPPMIKSYADDNYKRLNNLFYLSNKFIYYGLLMVCAPLVFEMDTVLFIWLGNPDKITVVFCRIIVIYSIILSLNNPISIIIQATGKMKQYVVPVESVTLLTPVIVYVVLAFGAPPVGCFYVMLILITITHFVRLLCLKKIYSLFSFDKYLRGFVLPAIYSLLLMFSMCFIVHIRISHSYFRLALEFVLTIFATLSIAYFFALTKEEKEIINKMIR